MAAVRSRRVGVAMLSGLAGIAAVALVIAGDVAPRTSPSSLAEYYQPVHTFVYTCTHKYI